MLKKLKKLRKMLNRSLENTEITYKKLQDILKENPDAILLDVRSSQEFAEGHLNKAINIPLHNLEKIVQNAIQDKNKIIIMYCTSGHRSKQAKKILEKLDYTNLYNLKGGLDYI